MPRRFLIAPDKFKGSLSASEAAGAMAAGVRRSNPDAEIDLPPSIFELLTHFATETHQVWDRL